MEQMNLQNRNRFTDIQNKGKGRGGINLESRIKRYKLLYIKWKRIYIYTHTHMYVHIYVYITEYMYNCIYVLLKVTQHCKSTTLQYK